MRKLIGKIPFKMNAVIFLIAVVALASWYFGTWSYKHFISSPLERTVCQKKCDIKKFKGNKIFNTTYQWKNKTVNLECTCL
jgi:hypothetical protein